MRRGGDARRRWLGEEKRRGGGDGRRVGCVGGRCRPSWLCSVLGGGPQNDVIWPPLVESGWPILSESTSDYVGNSQ